MNSKSEPSPQNRPRHDAKAGAYVQEDLALGVNRAVPDDFRSMVVAADSARWREQNAPSGQLLSSAAAKFPRLITDPLMEDQRAALSRIESFLTATDPGAPGVLVINGYAGTGKTSLLSAVVSWCNQNHRPSLLLAATNSAVENARARSPETFNKENARTLHSVLYGAPRNGYFNIGSPKSLPPCEVVFLDESSLVQTEVLLDLLQAVKRQGRKLIMVGDNFQLGAIETAQGKANPFTPLREPHLSLTRVIRQGPESGILDLARRTRTERKVALPAHVLTFSGNGSAILPEGEGGWKYERAEGRTVALFSALWNRAPGSVAAIVGKNEDRVDLNRRVREALYSNPAEPILAGEPLVALSNTKVFSNGAVFRAPENLRSLNATPFHLSRLDETTGRRVLEQAVLFEAEIFKDTFLRVALFPTTLAPSLAYSEMMQHCSPDLARKFAGAIPVTYGYALTCHKAQGMEWENVIIAPSSGLPAPILGEPDGASRWYYTALTRARSGVFVETKPGR